MMVGLAWSCPAPVWAQQPVGGETDSAGLARGSQAVLAAAPPDGWVPAHESVVAPMRRSVELDLTQATVGDALKIVARRGEFRVWFGPDVSGRSAPRVTLHVARMSVADALAAVLQGTGLEAYVSLSGRDVLVRQALHDGLPLIAALSAHRQQGGGTIGGRVTDAVTKVPLDQVAVRVEGPGLGGVTGSDGRYTVHSVPPGTYRVTARRVGYTPLTRTVTVADSVTAADFALVAAPTRLNEMVTTAVGDQRRYEVGNTISTIRADSIAPTAPIMSLTDLMSARAPGVTIEETNGLIGAGEAIRVRGQSSVVLQSDPIVIVDGVRQDNAAGSTAILPMLHVVGAAVPSPARLNDLNFSDIETIDVLKGPAASTEYGTDAANGVIVITTKHGTAGRPQWQASAEEATSSVPERFPALYYSWGHTTGANPVAVQCPLVPYFTTFGSAVGTCAVDSVTTWDPLNNSHYSIFGVGHRQRYNASVSGGSDAVRYFIAGNLSNEIGLLRLPGAFASQAASIGLPHSTHDPNGEDQRSMRTTGAIRLGPTADLTVAGAYLSTYQTSANPQTLYAGVVTNAPIRDAAHGYGYGSSPYYTPTYQFGNLTNQTTSRLTGGLTGSWRPTSWFIGHGTIGIDHGSQKNSQSVLPQVAPLDPFIPAQLGIANTTTDVYTMDLRGSATAALARSVRLTTSLGAQLADARTQGLTAAAAGIAATNYTLNGSLNPTVTQLGDRRATLGGYGEEQMAVSDRLFLTGALRVDAGSGFGRAYSTAAYPKASVSWLAVTEGAATLRVRGAFGQSGVQPPNGAALQLYAPTTVGLSGLPTTAVAIANVQDQLLRPERSEEYEGGVDIGLWQNRVSLEVTGYSKTTRDALVSLGTGWDAGGLPYEENIGTVRNWGVEGTVTASLAQTRGLTLDVTANASLNRNRLVTLASGVTSQQLTGAAAVYRFAAGYPLYGYWGPRVQYADLNHDGVIEPGEVTVANSLSYAGSSFPTREASVGLHAGVWAGAVDVSALVDYRGGFRLMNTTAMYEAAQAAQIDRASNDRTAPIWEQARDVAAEVITVSGVNGSAPPTGFYDDASFVRVRELSVAYTLPRTVVRALRAQHINLVLAVRNLALWTRYTGIDPEVTNSLGFNAQLSPTSNTSIVNNDMREDLAAVPLLRYWVVRLNVGL